MIFMNNNKLKGNPGRFRTLFFLERKKITNHKDEEARKYFLITSVCIIQSSETINFCFNIFILFTFDEKITFILAFLFIQNVYFYYSKQS